MIDQFGIYGDMSEVDYHADPFKGGSLSSSDARLLLESPAKYRWRRDNGQEFKDIWDFGKAAHALVLGVGSEVVVVAADDWRSKAAQAERDEAREAGLIPVLAKDWEIVLAMAAAIRAHSLASRLLDRELGAGEQSLFWQDRRTGITRRARLDWLPVKTDRRMVVPDYKTTRSAAKDDFARSVASFGYHLQADWYLDGIRALCGEENPAFLFIAQEKDPPFLVNVVELDQPAMDIAAAMNRAAVDVYCDCMSSNTWPGYPEQVDLVSLPRWAQYQFEEEYAQ